MHVSMIGSCDSRDGVTGWDGLGVLCLKLWWVMVDVV